MHLAVHPGSALTPAAGPPACIRLRQDGAPFSGTFRPTQKLAFLYQGGTSTTAGHGGSQGAWVLHVEDVAPNATR